MLIDLSEVLSEPHKSIDEVVGTEMKEVKVNGSRFPVSRTQPVHIHVEYAGEKKLHISCETSLTVIIPCDRCLTDLTVNLAKPATYAEICAAMKEASEGELKGVLGRMILNSV